jgi:hypothetical protein
MHTIHLVAIEDGNELLRVRAVREALRTLYPAGSPDGGDWTARDADEAIEAAQNEGAYLLGESHDVSFLANVAAALDENGCTAIIDHHARPADAPPSPPSPEEVFSQAPDADERASGDGAAAHDATEDAPTGERPLFSTEAYETAMAMLAICDGKPAVAAAHARTLGRTTADEDLYVEAINALLVVFPWIRVPLEANGIVVFEQELEDA